MIQNIKWSFVCAFIFFIALLFDDQYPVLKIIAFLSLVLFYIFSFKIILILVNSMLRKLKP